ncbi:MAG: hypothetical protein RQ736_11240 [Thiogranum sp.]|nr:hypothetical protein [Thiogranum sp.]
MHICIEIEVVSRDYRAKDDQRMCGYVIHRSGQGIGLMLVNPSQNQLHSLSRLRRDRIRAESTLVATARVEAVATKADR